jgi:hypothetical protein
MAAVLLPWSGPQEIDWHGFDACVARTVDAGLVPAVNMDTGFVQLLDPPARHAVLARAAAITGGGALVAGAFVADQQGASFDLDAYRRAMGEVAAVGATPVVFPSWGLAALDEDGWVDAHRQVAGEVDRFFAFELGSMFVPYGRIYSLDAYGELLRIDACAGAKHSSLRRTDEWARLALRDTVRPDFRVLTGNDLAIDMVMWGSDYLLGLAAFAPDAFAARDAAWAVSDPSFYAYNDLLQYLGQHAFRAPVPAYRHSAAMFLRRRGWIESSEVPDGAPRRPDWEAEILDDIARRLDLLLAGGS